MSTDKDSNKPHAGWIGSLEQLLLSEPQQIISALLNHHSRALGEPANPSQITAWGHCLSVLFSELEKLITSNPGCRKWSALFEYELPRERGRRPDVVLLGASTVIVLEFKDFSAPLPQHVDQVSAYARDLGHYHSLCHAHRILPVLVLTQARQFQSTEGGVKICSGDLLATCLIDTVESDSSIEVINPNDWALGEYAPLPSLIVAARRIFNHEPLPQIRRAQSAGIPLTLEYLSDVARSARDRNERHLALVTGVPGAGKTLVGLQFVYDRVLGEIEEAKHAVFLSGNGPLVKVLQHALKSRVFVQDVHGFLRQYGGESEQSPREHIWVYDEAQRAWDADRVSEKRQHPISEPEDFLRIGQRIDSWALMVGLIGEGQEIHLGEEGGLAQWNLAIKAAAGEWIVHCPPKLAKIFDAARDVVPVEKLDLTKSLRSHLAEDVQAWISSLLDGQLDQANSLADRVLHQGFQLYVTQDLESAKAYVMQRYGEEIDKRFGLLASSKAKNLPQYGIRNDFSFTKNLREGPWYNDPPNSKYSCCQLNDVATEFACQGLELDFPIVCWGNDLWYEDGKWRSPVARRSSARNPHQLRLNSYRVLLSRGRDGMVIYVPPDDTMASTMQALLSAGLRPLIPERIAIDSELAPTS